MTITFRAVSVRAFAVLLALHPVSAHAQQWIEMKSPHFVVTSNAGQSSTRTLAWQLEQVHTAISTMFAWARVELDRPVAVYAVKDERSMRALAPGYWEVSGGLRPASVWVSAPDQHYFAIRADVQVEDRNNINPHMTAYKAYVSLILQQSGDRDLPLWFSSGFSGVLSNTIVRDTHILFGPPIPWHLERLRELTRMRLPALMKVTRSSPEYTNAELRNRFDAQSWALVHFLLFGRDGVRRPKLEQFIRLFSSGIDVDAAVREALEPLAELEGDFHTYINRGLYTYLRVTADASVKRETFPTRELSASESAARMALFHVAMNRPVEARAAIEEARKTAPAADSFVAEAMLLEREGKREEARTAFEWAVDAGTTSNYAHYNLATLRWVSRPDRDALVAMEKLLLKALALNNRHAGSNAFLAEVRSLLGTGEPMPFALRAITLAPSEPTHRLTAARILLRQQKYDEALKQAQTAVAMAGNGDARPEAEDLIASIERAKSGRAVERAEPREQSQRPEATEGGTTDAPVRVGPGVVSPRMLEDAKPAYTREALRMRVHGTIRLEAVVPVDGVPTEVRITQCELKTPLQDSTNKEDAELQKALTESKFKPGECTETFGLDRSAIEAVKQWRFTPATRAGKAVPAIVQIEMSFALR